MFRATPEWSDARVDQVNIPNAGRIILNLTRLESRDTPSGNLPWPVIPGQGQRIDLVEGYGQFSQGGFLHFHEGIDVISPSGNAGYDVYAILGGKVREFDSGNAALSQRFVEINSGTVAAPEGWSYFHTDPTAGLTYGSNVTLPQVVGTIAPQPQGAGWPHHLHLVYGEGTDPYFAASGKPNRFRPTKDPLELLSSLNDAVAPQVSGVFFRRGDDDISGVLTVGSPTPNGNLVDQSETITQAHRYFLAQDKQYGAVIVGAQAGTVDGTGAGGGGTAGIDIIAEATDRIVAGGELVGIKSIGFKLKGLFVRTQEMAVDKSFDFTGEYVPDVMLGNGKQSYESLRDAALVRTVYENDSQHESQDRVRYNYTVTNKDDDLKVQTGDRDRRWFTDRVAGSAWNNGAAAKAANNAKSEWPDDYYDVTVTAKDEAGNAGSTTKRVLLDNRQQTLTAQLIASSPGWYRLRFTGDQWTANSMVKLYQMTSPFAAGDSISAHGEYIGPMYTDADGKIIPIDYWVNEPANQTSPWYFLADYHNGGDNIYEPQLDATATLEIDESPPLLRAGGDAAAAADFAASSAATTPAVPGHQTPPPKSGIAPTIIVPVEAPPDAKRSEPPTMVVAASPGVAPLAAFDLADWSRWGNLEG